MRYILQTLGGCLWMPLLVTGMIACATFYDLRVRYQLPEASSTLDGIRMELAFQDDRPAKAILGPGAVPEFKNFTGDITFSIEDATGAELTRGQYREMEMVREAFKKRIEAEGVTVAAPGETGGLRLTVVVNRLLLDLMDGRWVAQVEFEARLEKDGTLLATQKISGEAERHLLVGRREAHRAVSDIFTESVNRLDFNDLIQQAATAHPGMLER